MSDERINAEIDHIIADIEDAASAAADLVSRGREAWNADRVLRLAGEAIVGRVGESSTRLPNSVKLANPELPWREMAGIRIVVDHSYRDVDYDIIWNTLETDIPGFVRDLKRWRLAQS